MILECPHCHRRVLPLSSGECPSCHKNTADTIGVDQNVTMLSITEITKFPQLCCACADPTTNRVTIARKGRLSQPGSPKQTSSEPYWPVYFVFGPIWGFLIDMFSRIGGGGNSGPFSLAVKVPQCKKCVAMKKIEPSVVDLEHCRFGIVVDKRFAAAVTELNRK
jgi:hypothetical protein